MIQGRVIGLEAQVKLVLCLPNQRRVQIECVVDTGFAGALTLPPAIVAKLELPFVIRMNANLAYRRSISQVSRALTEAQRRTLKAYGAVEELRIENDELRMEEME
jgi:predicted aspartyl protease